MMYLVRDVEEAKDSACTGIRTKTEFDARLYRTRPCRPGTPSRGVSEKMNSGAAPWQETYRQNLYLKSYFLNIFLLKAYNYSILEASIDP